MFKRAVFLTIQHRQGDQKSDKVVSRREKIWRFFSVLLRFWTHMASFSMHSLSYVFPLEAQTGIRIRVQIPTICRHISCIPVSSSSFHETNNLKFFRKKYFELILINGYKTKKWNLKTKSITHLKLMMARQWWMNYCKTDYVNL